MSERFTLEVLKLFDDLDMHNDLYWSVEGDKISFHINCNDLFWWGCADAESLTPENLSLLKQAIVDVREVLDEKSVDHRYPRDAFDLFVCRVRGMRLQGAAYPKDRRLWPLFDAVGPERETGMSNPYRPGQREEIAAKKVTNDTANG